MKDKQNSKLKIKKFKRSYFSLQTLKIWILFLTTIYTIHFLSIKLHKYIYYKEITIMNTILYQQVPFLITQLILLNIFYTLLYKKKFPYFKNQKISNHPFPWEENPEKFKKDLPKIIFLYLFNFVFLVLIGQIVFSPLYKVRIDQSYPSFLETLLGILIFTFYEDFNFYWSHRFLHLPFMYSKIHKIHHTYFNVFHLNCVYTHPLEFLLANFIPASLGMAVCGPYFHFCTYTVFMVFRIFETHEAHGGYEFPLSIFKVNPWGIESNYHNFHHLKNIGNYSTFFFLWDSIFGTNKYYFEVENTTD